MCTHHISSFLQKLKTKCSVLLHSCSLFKHKHYVMGCLESIYKSIHTTFTYIFLILCQEFLFIQNKQCMCFYYANAWKDQGSRDFHVTRGLPSGGEWRSRTWQWDQPSAGRSWRTTWPLFERLSPPRYCPKDASWPKISIRNTSPQCFYNSWESQMK